MRLISITVRNYRIHRDLTVAFDPSRTVIGGPNESGKSTLVEAVHRALFLRSRASGAVLDAMRSHFHPGHPSVELTFESRGTTYTVSKQFTGTNAAPTTLTVAGSPPLRNEQAEEALEEILAIEAVAGRGAEDKLRLQWAHLWVWQGVSGTDPLDRDSIGMPLERLRERLGSLEAGDVLESRLDAAVGTIVAETYGSWTKENGTSKAGSPLGEADTALADARSKRATAQAAIDALEGAAADVERADATIAESESSLAARRREQEENGGQLDEARRLEILQAEQQATATTAVARLAGLTEGDRQIRESEARIASIEARRAPAAERQAAAGRAEKEAEERATTAQADARACQREQADVAELAELHSQAEHLERRRTERVGLAGRCGRIAALRAEAIELQARFDSLPAVSSADLSELASLERRHDAAQATLDAIATRVELLAADGPVRLGDHELVKGASETITADSELAVGGARLRISPGGGTSLTEATRLRDDAAAALEDRLRRASVADVDEARRIQPLRQTVESALEAKRTAIEGLGGAEADGELAELDEEIVTLERDLTRSSRSDFIHSDGLDVAIAARRAIDERLHQLVQSLATATAAQQAAEMGRTTAREERSLADEAVRKVDDELRTEQARRTVLIEEHGSDRQLVISAATSARDDAEEALAATKVRLSRLQPEMLRQASSRLQRAVEKLIEGKQAAQAARTIGLDRLRNEGTLDPREDLARAIVNERLAETRQRRAAREARAYALLSQLFAEKKRDVEARFVGPLTTRVADYLRCLFGIDATIAVEYQAGQFQSLTLTRPDFGGAAFAFSQLSGGGREQVAAAFRMAMAEILAEDHGGCLPIVFDDAFVNSDPSRVAAVLAMLDLAAVRGLQVIVLSCNHREYDALGATTIEFSRPSSPSP